jgi:hypothetical protein
MDSVFWREAEGNDERRERALASQDAFMWCLKCKNKFTINITIFTKWQDLISSSTEPQREMYRNSITMMI